MRLVVTGPRDWVDSRVVYWALVMLRDAQAAKGDPIEVVIHGDALGLDSLVDHAARGLGLDVKPYPAEWDRFRERRGTNPAGVLRNRVMLDHGQPTFALVFHPSPTALLETLKHSGTADMYRLIKAAGLPFVHIRGAADLEQLGSITEAVI